MLEENISTVYLKLRHPNKSIQCKRLQSVTWSTVTSTCTRASSLPRLPYQQGTLSQAANACTAQAAFTSQEFRTYRCCLGLLNQISRNTPKHCYLIPPSAVTVFLGGRWGERNNESHYKKKCLRFVLIYFSRRQCLYHFRGSSTKGFMSHFLANIS